MHSAFPAGGQWSIILRTVIREGERRGASVSNQGA